MNGGNLIMLSATYAHTQHRHPIIYCRTFRQKSNVYIRFLSAIWYSTLCGNVVAWRCAESADWYFVQRLMHMAFICYRAIAMLECVWVFFYFPSYEIRDPSHLLSNSIDTLMLGTHFECWCNGTCGVRFYVSREMWCCDNVSIRVNILLLLLNTLWYSCHSWYSEELLKMFTRAGFMLKGFTLTSLVSKIYRI